MHVREMKKEGRSKQGQTNNNANQHSTPKHVHMMTYSQELYIDKCRCAAPGVLQSVLHHR